MGMLSLDRNHPDYLKARVLVTLFGGYFGSRLMSNIREDKGYTYGISAAIMPYPGQGVLAVSAEAANEFVEPLIGEVYHEIDRLQNELASDGELSMVKNICWETCAVVMNLHSRWQMPGFLCRYRACRIPTLPKHWMLSRRLLHKKSVNLQGGIYAKRN